MDVLFCFSKPSDAVRSSVWRSLEHNSLALKVGGVSTADCGKQMMGEKTRSRGPVNLVQFILAVDWKGNASTAEASARSPFLRNRSDSDYPPSDDWPEDQRINISSHQGIGDGGGGGRGVVVEPPCGPLPSAKVDVGWHTKTNARITVKLNTSTLSLFTVVSFLSFMTPGYRRLLVDEV